VLRFVYLTVHLGNFGELHSQRHHLWFLASTQIALKISKTSSVWVVIDEIDVIITGRNWRVLNGSPLRNAMHGVVIMAGACRSILRDLHTPTSYGYCIGPRNNIECVSVVRKSRHARPDSGAAWSLAMEVSVE
jgi:hypothetical protein